MHCIKNALEKICFYLENQSYSDNHSVIYDLVDLLSGIMVALTGLGKSTEVYGYGSGSVFPRPVQGLVRGTCCERE